MKALGGEHGIFSYSCDNLSFTKRRSCKKVDKKTQLKLGTNLEVWPSGRLTKHILSYLNILCKKGEKYEKIFSYIFYVVFY